MMTVNEVSKLTGVSIRTLQYYDKIGLLHPAKYSESGYRLYDDTALENLICLARGIRKIGVKKMDFSAFDTSKMDEYAAQAKASWGNTPEYHEYEEKAKGRTKQEEQTIGENMMQIFTEFGTMLDLPPDSEKVQAQVKKLQDYITENFYTCSDDILHSLGNMYAGGGDFTTNIDNAGGAGTAEFVSRAIKIYCGK